MKIEYTIVFGCPRSGTTFLSRAINAVPGLESLIGTLLPEAIPQIVRQPDVPEKVVDALAIGFERSLDLYMHSGRFHSRAMALQKWFNTRNGIGGLSKALRGPRLLNHIVYKEPALAFSPDFVLRSFPESKIIYIYRDGRDVANSLVKSYDEMSDEMLASPVGLDRVLGRRYDSRYIPWWVEDGRDQEFIDSTPYVRSIWMWKEMVRECAECFDRHNDAADRILQIRYEDMMTDPEPFGEKILAHLGEEPTSRFRKVMRSAHVKSIGNYKKRDAAEVSAAERVAGDELRLLGYLGE